MTTTTTKPGRLTDSKWWFCQIDQHDRCAVEIELTSCFEGCPCECHQTTQTQPAPESGEWQAWLQCVTRQLATRPEGGMNSACGEYNCPCHYELPRVVEIANAVPRLMAILEALDNYYCASGKLWDDARTALATLRRSG